MRRLYEELPRHLEKIFGGDALREVFTSRRLDAACANCKAEIGYLIQSGDNLGAFRRRRDGWRYAFGDFDVHYESDVCLRAAAAFGDVLSSIVDHRMPCAKGARGAERHVSSRHRAVRERD